jgi:hypothetical protein
MGTGTGALTLKLKARTRSSLSIGSLSGTLVALACGMGAGPSLAKADSICTFTSNVIARDERHTRQTLTFSWNNTTGAIQQNGPVCSASGALAGGTAYWDDFENGAAHVQCGLASLPGNVTPGFAPGGKLSSSVYLVLANGGEIRATLHIGGAQNARPIVFSGAWYGEKNYLLAGYGSVTCTP